MNCFKFELARKKKGIKNRNGKERKGKQGRHTVKKKLLAATPLQPQ
jgi:hypothetical protein